VVDINLACPVKKIRKKSRGGHLLEAPDEAISILDAVRQAVPPHVPCTVKLRRGSDDSADAEANFRRIFEAAIRLGYAGAVVHARSVAQKYVGPARWPFLSDLVAQYGDEEGFTIGGSGDIWKATDIFAMIRQTGVALVSVARGCIGNPWIFAQGRALQRGDREGGGRPPTLAQQRAVLRGHFALSVDLHGERLASMMMRKFGIRFSVHHPDREAVKNAFIAVKSSREWIEVLDDYYSGDEELAAHGVCAAAGVESDTRV